MPVIATGISAIKPAIGPATPMSKTARRDGIGERILINAPNVPAGPIIGGVGRKNGGRLREFAAQLHPTWAKVVADGEWGHIPNAETSVQLQNRCVAALQQLHARHANQRVLCVVHGGVIGALLAYAVGSKGRALDGSDNCSLHTVVVLGTTWQLRRFNDTAHLDQAPVT